MELDDAGATGDQARMVDELGDVLFSVVNVARHLGVEPEGALRRATAKFEQRFRRVEQLARGRYGELGRASPAVLDELWESVKAERDRGGR